MLALLRRRNFALLWFAGAVSMLGDWVLLIALPFYVYDLTGSALATGATFMASTLPRVFLSSVAGVFVDRWDRQRTLIVADVARGFLLLLLLLVRSADTIWIVYLVATLEAMIAQFFSPAKSAFVPRLVEERELLHGNALSSLSDNLTRLVGPALGGFLYVALGLPSIALLDSASFLISGLLIALIRVRSAECGLRTGEEVAPRGVESSTPAVARRTPIRNPQSAIRIWQEWLTGMRIVGRNRLLTGLFVGVGLAMIGEGLFVSLIVPFTKVVLGGDATQLGWLMSAQAIGGVTGGLLIGRIGKLLSPLRQIAIAGILDGLLLLGVINGGSVVLALILITLAGLPIVALFVSVQTLVQTHTEDQHRGRVFGALSTVSALMTLAGMGIAAALGDRLGIAPTLSLGGVAYLLAGLYALTIRPVALPVVPSRAGGAEAPVAGN